MALVVRLDCGLLSRRNVTERLNNFAELRRPFPRTSGTQTKTRFAKFSHLSVVKSGGNSYYSFMIFFRQISIRSDINITGFAVHESD